MVGTGGTTLRASGAIEANGRARNASTHGVLRLTLNADNYAWKFVPVAGRIFTDPGTTSCH